MPPSRSRSSKTPLAYPDADGSHIEDFIAFRVAVLAHLMGRIVGLTCGRRFGVSLRQWRVLAFVGRYGKLSALEVARLSPLDKSQVSRAAAELIEHGCLRSTEAAGDRRRKQLMLTAAGRRLHARLLALGRQRNTRYAGVLTDAERAVFERGLRKLTDEARTMVRDLQASGREPRVRRAAN